MPTVTPGVVSRALKKVGSDLRDARRRRRISTAVMADRMGVSRQTLHRLENGDSTVAIGTYATALFVLRLLERFRDVAALSEDEIGLSLAQEQLPKRIRYGSRD
jgi:transcriptional regulator with XRE-family HTH domain